MIKSLFISGYMATCFAGLVVFMVLYVQGGLNWPIGFMGLASFSVLVYFASLYTFFLPPRSNPSLPVLSTVVLSLSVAGAGLSAYSSYWLSFAFALAAGIGWLCFVFWYSKLDRKPSSLIAVGNSLPYMEFRDIDQSKWTTAELKGKPALLVFYRGTWCPLCMSQVRELVNDYKSFSALGVNIYFISPQPVSMNQVIADRFKLPIKFLRDEDLKFSQKLGIFHAAGTPVGMQVFGFDTDTVFPTVLGIDADGIIRISDQTNNYRIRTSPAMLVEAFKSMPHLLPSA